MSLLTGVSLISVFSRLVVFMMTDFHDLWVAVKFCFPFGKTGTKTIEMLKTTYKHVTIGKTQVFD